MVVSGRGFLVLSSVYTVVALMIPQAGECPTALAGIAAANPDGHDHCFAASIADIMAAVGINRHMGADKPLIFYCA